MRNYIKIIIALLLLMGVSGCAHQQRSKKDILNNVDTSLLGIDFKTFLEHITYDEIQKVEGCCWGIKRDGELLIVLYDKKGLADQIVRNFEILSPAIIFNDQFRVGMTIENLLEIYPSIELLIDENDYKMEYFSPPALLSYTSDGGLDRVVVFEVVSETGKPLSINDNYPTMVFSKAGYISKISVFKW